MIRAATFYALVIAGLWVVLAWQDGSELTPARVASAAVFVAIAAFGLWLRIDGARQRRRERREGEANP